MQDFELWWLLVFPAFFGLGWLAARIDMRAVLAQAKAVPSAYFRGLHALLDDNTEVAVRELTEVARANPKAFELELAVGRLHRRRGENDLAIRLHQRMLDDQELPANQKDRVRLELAEDFLRAGLVDRAEELLLSLEPTPFAQEVRQHLLAIYQQERNWTRAIDMARALRSEAMSYQHELSQFYCELAQAALFKSQLDEARNYLAEALTANRRSARASLIAGDIELVAGQTEAAIEAWLRVEKQNPEYLTLVAERLLDAYERLEKPTEGLALLRGFLQTFPELDLIDLLYPRIAQREGDEAALDFLRDAVHRRPTLAGMAKLIDARFASLTPDSRQDAELARDLVLTQVKRLSVHRCKRCQFRSKTFFWHCPACNEWETFTPNRTES